MWDVDHTLIETRGVGGEIYAETFAAVTGRALATYPDPTGLTEPALFAAALKVNGINDDGKLYDAFAREQAARYWQRMDEMRQQGRALPGVRNVVDYLATHPEIVQSVVTGNTRPVATAKLIAYDLATHIRLDIGAYGTDSTDRGELVRLARQRAESALSSPPDRAVVVGDTPADVRAGLDGGCRVIGIATGKPSTDDLRGAGAHHVFTALPSPDVFLELLQFDYG